MTEQSAPAAAAADSQAAGPQFNLQRIYLKDLSLEIPDAPAVFLDGAEPRLEFQIDAQSKDLAPGVCEVTVRCTVTCRLGDKVGFLVEAAQAGIFEIQGVTDEQYTLLKGISCPSIIYPYLRANIADVVQRASFPPVHLAELNWEAFYSQQLAQNNAKPAENSGLILPTQ
jgi:preprotein translocase subunit SecB